MVGIGKLRQSTSRISLLRRMKVSRRSCFLILPVPRIQKTFASSLMQWKISSSVKLSKTTATRVFKKSGWPWRRGCTTTFLLYLFVILSLYYYYYYYYLPMYSSVKLYPSHCTICHKLDSRFELLLSPMCCFLSFLSNKIMTVCTLVFLHWGKFKKVE